MADPVSEPTAAPAPVEKALGATLYPGSDTVAASGADTTAGSDTTAAGADSTAGGADTTAGSDSVSGDATTGADTQAGDDTKAASGDDSIAPLTADSYTFEFPETFKADDKLMAEAKTTLAEAGVKPEDAQKLVGVYVKAQEAAAKAQQDAFVRMNETWRNESLALPEFQGERKVASEAAIAKLVDEFGSPEVREVLNATGAGNSPALVKFILNVANALSEGKAAPQGRPAIAKGARTPGQILYPDAK